MNQLGQCSINFNICPKDTFCPATAADMDMIDCLPCDDHNIHLGQGCNCVANFEFENCQVCGLKRCKTCISGFFPDQIGMCSKCDENCVTCYSRAFCTTCKPGFLLDARDNTCYRACTENSDCQEWNAGYCDLEQRHCRPCQKGCSICLSGSFCVQCLEDNSYSVITINGTCTKTCQDLKIGYYCKDGVVSLCDENITSTCMCGESKNCATCSDFTLKCGSCLPNLKMDMFGKCEECVSGYQKIGHMCLPYQGEDIDRKLSVEVIEIIVGCSILIIAAICGGISHYIIQKKRAAAEVI
ncbi:Cysteine-rich membrane protein 2 [Spironucleus salmonicida]|uniref:Cysteine-rich membrane protein 2 n=1 Tax=Spironucleus salmonicida TaxID=348837 RepID=A0A9P8LMU7_9EUKA|nr:Cysteine-rich membrane protein 2 [Spironucleus salmonicida]